jgi:hypothetical protein
MSELNLGPPPSPSRLPAILLATASLLAAAAAVIYFNPHQAAELAVTRVQIYAAHTVTPFLKGESNLIGAVPHADDDLYIVLTAKITNKSRVPLFIESENAVLTAPDHSIAEASAIQKNDLANLYTTFPALQALSSPPLARDTQIAPGQTAEGMVLFHIPGAKQQDWDKRESATLTLDLFHGPPQTVKIP